MKRVLFSIGMLVSVSHIFSEIVSPMSHEFVMNDKYVKGFKGYVNIEDVVPGQKGFTSLNAETKATKSRKMLHQFDNENASLPIESAIPVVKTAWGLVAADSHHEYIAATRLHDKTLPVEIKEDLSYLSVEEFIKVAHEKNLIYLYDKMGNKIVPTEGRWIGWNEMEDNPNRLFASLVALKFSAKNGDEKDPNASELPEHPLWRKNTDKKFELAFMEFKIARALYNAGLEYRYEWGVNPNDVRIQEITEKAREVLRKVQAEGQLLNLELLD